jgi:hypothetical protein
MVSGQGGGSEHGAASNNLAVPAIFAEGIGLLGLPTSDDPGLRPRPDEEVPALPYFNPSDVYVGNGVTYYVQQSSNVWQADWRDGGADEESATIQWSRNLLSHRWSPQSRVPIGIVLDSDRPAAMTGYPMTLLFGHGSTAVWGTTGFTEPSLRSTVFSVVARLRIEKITGPGGDPVRGMPVIDTAVYEQFGKDPGPDDGLVGHVSRCGQLGYRYRWSLRDLSRTPEEKLGWWRLSFSVASPARYRVATDEGERRMHVNRNVRLSGIGTQTHDEEPPLFVPRLHGHIRSTLEIEVAQHGTGEDEEGDSCEGHE